MQLQTILKRLQRHQSFVYRQAPFWDSDEGEINDSKMAWADLLNREPNGNHVLIRINQSWRTTSWC